MISAKQPACPRPSPASTSPSHQHGLTWTHRRNVPDPPCKGQAAGRGKTLPRAAGADSKAEQQEVAVVTDWPPAAAAKPRTG